MTVNQSFVLREIYGKHILVPFRTNEVSSDPILLNDIAHEIWMNAGSSTSSQALVETIAGKYKLQDGSAQYQSVKLFVDQLIGMGLLREGKG